MAPPIFINFAGQNWVITPAALAVGERRPADIGHQHWLLILSGVCIVDVQGTHPHDWRRETLQITPDISAPLEFAINRYAIPVPAGRVPQFNLDQWAPFAAVSSIFHKDTTDAGFAVDVWRPAPFRHDTDQNGNPLTQLFNGVDVDIAVLNDKAILHRVSYQFTLLGQIVFAEPME